MTLQRCVSRCAALLVILIGSFAVQPARASGQAEVAITVKDEVGTPVQGVEVVLTPLDTKENQLPAAPWTAKTNKKGSAMLPFLPYNEQGQGRYEVSIKHEGYFIQEFHIESRQVPQGSGRGTLIQDDQAKIAPGQKPQPLMAKPQGKVTIDLVIALLSSVPQRGSSAAPSPTAAVPAAEQDPLGNARSLMAAGKLDEAESALKSLSASKPSAEVDFETARLYHLQEKPAEEKAALLRTLEHDPAYPKANYAMGRLAYEGGHPDQALAAFEAECRSHPDDAQSGSALAALYVELGRPPDAIKTYESLVILDPTNTDALVSLDGLYTSQGEAKKSEEVYKKILALNPTGADQVYYKVGANLSKREDLSASDRARAAAAFQKATQLNPKNAKAHRELAYALIGLGKVDEAKPHFQTYLQLEPGAKDAASIRQFLQGT